MSNIILTAKDIDLLSKDMSSITKSETIKKISQYYKEEKTLSIVERKIAEDIFRIMISDIEVIVREVLADSLKSAKQIPSDIVHKIINDEESVSLSFINEYKDFSPEDLIRILDTDNVNKQKAVVTRKHVPGDVSHHVALKCSEEIVGTLLNNSGSEIFDNTYNIIVDKYKDSENIKGGLVVRSSLPVFIADRILDSLSSSLQKKLLENHNISVDIVSNVLDQVRDRASFAIFSGYNSDEELENLIKELYELGKLNDRLIVRALCVGNLKFFEYALAFLTKKKTKEVRKIIFFSTDDFVVRNLLREAKIAVSYFPIVLAALKIIREIDFEDHKVKISTWSKKVLERLLTLEAISNKIEDLDLRYFMTKIS